MRTPEAENGGRHSGLTTDDEDDLDDALARDIEALRQVCLNTGSNLGDTNNFCDGDDDESPSISGRVVDEDSGEDDFEILRGIQQRFMTSDKTYEALSPKPLCAIHPDTDDDGEDDLEMLISLQRRFGANSGTDANGGEIRSKRFEEEQTSIVTSEAKVSDEPLVGKTNAFRVVEDFEDTANNTANLLSDSMEMQPAGSSHESASCQSSKSFMSREASQMIFGAIKKNRSLQNLLQTKLSQIKAKLEENNDLRKRIKILKDLQVSCRQNTGRSLAQGKNPRIQLISAQSTICSKDSKGKNVKSSPICSGPEENAHVPNYREALVKFPLSLERRKWEKSEDKKLKEGLEQQFQEMLVKYKFSASEHNGDTENLDMSIMPVGNMEITPEIMKEFLPKVDWNQLASKNVEGRSGPECQARWLNSACPLINNSGWTRQEEKLLLHYIQSKGIHNWSEIASLLGKNRTPFQCLERYQRSLNSRVLNKEWTKEEDAQLKAAVLKFGESDWQSVAATLRGRTGAQCSNRWLKSLRVYGKGHWKAEEDKRLKLAVKFFGPKDWKKVASFVPGRKDVQCRERWHNACSPSLNRGAWTDEEDSQLKAAVEEHGHSWSKVSHHVPGRTDNDCMRRWKVLFPEKVPLLKEARKFRKAALITNFVDREEDRPALGLEDLLTTPLLGLLYESDKMDQSGKSRRKQSNAEKKTRPKRTVKRAQDSLQAGGNGTADAGDAESCGGNIAAGRKRTANPRRQRKDHAEPPREPSPDSICSPLRSKNGKELLVYTRRKKGLGMKNSQRNLSKEANSSAEKDAKAPSLNEVSTKGINALRPHHSRHQEQKMGPEKDSHDVQVPVGEPWDNVTLSSLRTSKKRKRNHETDNGSKTVIRGISEPSSPTEDVQAISDSEATIISAELQCRETSCHMTIDSRRDPSSISIYSRKRKKIHEQAPVNQKHDDSGIDDADIPRARSVACVSDVTS